MWGRISIAEFGDGRGCVAKNLATSKSWEQPLVDQSKQIGTSVLQPQENNFFYKHLNLKENPKIQMRKWPGYDLDIISLVDSDQRTQINLPVLLTYRTMS